MRGGISSPGIIFSASIGRSTHDHLRVPHPAATGGQESIDELIAARSELNRFSADLTTPGRSSKVVEADKARRQRPPGIGDGGRTGGLFQAVRRAARSLTSKYDTEQRAEAAAARARASGSVQVGSFICPFTPGRTSFIDSWGLPQIRWAASQRDRHDGRLWRADVRGDLGSGVATSQQLARGELDLAAGRQRDRLLLRPSLRFQRFLRVAVSQGQTIGFNGDQRQRQQVGAPTFISRSTPVGEVGSGQPLSDRGRGLQVTCYT